MKRKANGSSGTVASPAPVSPLTPKELLDSTGKTMTDVALSTGLTISYMSLLFGGKRVPSLKTTKRIASALGRPFEEVAQVFSQ